MLVKVKYANIINIAAEDEIIPELIRKKIVIPKIYSSKVTTYLNDNQLMQNQIDKYQKILNKFKTDKSSEIASVLINSF